MTDKTDSTCAIRALASPSLLSLLAARGFVSSETEIANMPGSDSPTEGPKSNIYSGYFELYALCATNNL